MKLIHASAAILIDKAGHVLIAERQPPRIMPHYWEFPGGKLEAGETPEQALTRELQEEIGITATEFTPLTFISETRDADTSPYHVVVYVFTCRSWHGTPTGKEQQPLAWVRVDDLLNYHLLPSNISLVTILQKFR